MCHEMTFKVNQFNSIGSKLSSVIASSDFLFFVEERQLDKNISDHQYLMCLPPTEREALVKSPEPGVWDYHIFTKTISQNTPLSPCFYDLSSPCILKSFFFRF